MSNYLKLFRAEFEKYAQDAPTRRVPRKAPAAAPAGTAPPAGAAPAPAGGAPHRGGPRPAPTGGGQVNSVPAVKAMQEALISLAGAVTAQINIKDIAPKEPLTPAQMAPQTYGPGQKPPAGPEATREQTEAMGRGSFNDFIAKMMRKSDVPGVEFDPSPTKTQMSQKQPSEATRMGVIMDTMSRVGNPKSGEFKAEGLWGPRTNAALHNAYAFASAMLNLAKSFGLKKVTAYNEDALKQFLVPESEKDIKPEDKANFANIFTKHIKAIHKMYDQIKAGILEKPAYQAYIEGEPYDTFDEAEPGKEPGKAAPVPLDQQAIASMQERFKNGFPVLFYNVQTRESQTIPVYVQDLLSPQSLQDWQYKNQTGMEASDILRQVKDRLAGRPIRPIPSKYEDTLSPSDRKQFFKRNPDLKEQADKEQKAQVSGKVGV